MPVNLHAQSTIVGRSKVSGTPITEAHGIKHYCVPLLWHFFDVEKSQYWSGYDVNLGQTVYLHFDNSITILYQPHYGCYLLFKKPYDLAVKKWNGYEYLEFSRFETVQRLFEAKFIEGKRGLELFGSIGLTRKTLSKKSSRTKRKYIRKAKPIPLSRFEKSVKPIPLGSLCMTKPHALI